MKSRTGSVGARLGRLGLVVSLVALATCADLDGFVYNARHCSQIDATSCEDTQWQQLCARCDDPYDWDRDYDWMPQTLEPGQTVRVIDAEQVVPHRLPTRDGEGALDLYFIPAHGGDAQLAQVTVLYGHGNYASIEHYLPRLRYLHEFGVNIVVWDYRGYGKSMPAQTASGQQFMEDARQVREFAQTLAPDPDRLVVYGYSLGALPSIEGAVHRAPCALVIESGFTSIEHAGEAGTTLNLPGSFLSTGYFENHKKLDEYRGPLLWMHGDRDETLPLRHGRELYEEAASSERAFWVVEGAQHGISNGGVPETGLTDYFETMRGFLQEKTACLP